MPGAMLSIDRAQVSRDTEIFITAVLAQATRAVGAETRGLEKDLEKLTQQNVPGNLYRAWKSEVYPRGGKPAYAPRGRVFVNGGRRSQAAMEYWTQAGINRASSGGYLAVPIAKNAGPQTRGRNLTPGEWERRNGIRLEFVYRGGSKPSLLVAPNVVRGANHSGVRAASGRRMAGQHYKGAKASSIPIFVLIPLQRFANKFSIEPAVQRRAQMLLDNLDRRMARLNRAGAAALSD